MKRILGTVFVLAVLCLPRAGLAWDAPGHTYAGAIADQLLNEHARREVHRQLGFSLAVAATWPDCVKSVHPNGNGEFKFTPDPDRPDWGNHCLAFTTKQETARMEDYVRRNWSNCPASPGHGCHESYHYTDVSTFRDQYKLGQYGSSPHDVVGSVGAAVAVLQGKPPPSPYSIVDKKEALFLVAHFVGDLHQPLHVGGVYLTPGGVPVDPDAPGAGHSGTGTAGGNFIRDGKKILHAEWDHMPDGLTDRPQPAAIQAARRVPLTGAAPADLAGIWASDTLMVARRAFEGVSFVGAEQQRWTAKIKNRRAYMQAKDEIQSQQLIKAGARLAELLNAIWP
jgi:hypothetical protein